MSYIESHSEIETANRAELQAMLCGLTHAVTKTEGIDFKEFLARVDWKQAGISQSQFELWWKQHQLEDEERSRVAESTGMMGCSCHGPV